jgi:hypothetical protein
MLIAVDIISIAIAVIAFAAFYYAVDALAKV